MNRVEVNMMFCEWLGMTKIDKMPAGAFWDPETKRTRMVRDSEMHKTRRERGIRENANGTFLFDAYTILNDLERIEKAAGIDGHNAVTRVNAILHKLEIKNEP